MKSAAGTTSAPRASAPERRSSLVHSTRTQRKPANGIQRKIAYVGWMTASASAAAPADASRARVGERIASNESASAAGTSSWSEVVEGSDR